MQFSCKNRDPTKVRLTATSEFEIPAHVNEFLERIGIPIDTVIGSYSAAKFESRTYSTDRQNERTTKLVGHVFECLDALQYLVKESQSIVEYGIENERVFSVDDGATTSVGKLLHEMVKMYGLSGDAIKGLLTADPDAAGVEDTLGRLLLHVCCDRDEPWKDMVEALIEAKPEVKSIAFSIFLKLFISTKLNSLPVQNRNEISLLKLDTVLGQYKRCLFDTKLYYG